MPRVVIVTVGDGKPRRCSAASMRARWRATSRPTISPSLTSSASRSRRSPSMGAPWRSSVMAAITLRGITWSVARAPAPSLTSSTCASAKCPLASASAMAFRIRSGVTRSPGRIWAITGGRTSGQRSSSTTTSTATSGRLRSPVRSGEAARSGAGDVVVAAGGGVSTVTSSSGAGAKARGAGAAGGAAGRRAGTAGARARRGAAGGGRLRAGRLGVSRWKHAEQQGKGEHELREPHPSHAAGIIVEKARVAVFRREGPGRSPVTVA